jgi:signal transduction histidine kinase
MSNDARSTHRQPTERARPSRLGLWSPGSIAARLALFAILLASLTAGLIGTLSYSQARRALEAEARSRLTVLASDVAEHLHRELEDRVADITSWAHLEVMRAVLYHDVDKALAEFLRQIVGGRQVYRAIACVGTDGEVIARGGDVVPLAKPAPLARPRVTLVSAVPDASERSLAFEVGVDHPDRPETTIATLQVLLDPQRLLDTMSPSIQRTGGSARVLVRSAAGDTIVSTGEPGARGDAMLRGIATMRPLSGADGPDLEIVVAEPSSVALAAVAGLRTTLFEVGAIVLILASVFGVLTAWRIGAPIRRLTATVRDITARGRLEEPVELPVASGEVGTLSAAFRAMMESLATAQTEALVQSRRAFLGEIAASIAHDVRTPLSVLKTSAQLLAREEIPPVERRQLAAQLAAEVDRLNGVVSSLVDLARPRRVSYQSESVAEIVDRAATFFAPQAAKLGVTIAKTLDGSVRVHGSADQLYQVFLNGIDNALQAMAGTGRLSIRCRREDPWGVVELEDTGPGFAPEVLAKPFSPFYSTKRDGTGLGLAIAKRIIEEHGGTITLGNLSGGGACMRIRLPHPVVTG